MSVGDSYISGEAGRWAGNTNGPFANVDALGPTAYFDNAGRTAERIPLCHRSWAAEDYFGAGTIYGQTLACSGAKTSTFTNKDGDFKPGLDFYSNGTQKGQALMLRDFARGHTIKLVPLSIGGNNFNFGDIVGSCVATFLKGYSAYCKDDPKVLANFSAANIATQTAKMKQGILNIRKAMHDAGKADNTYTIVVQNYEAAIPTGSGFRYDQSSSRQWTGGCGIYNVDADWANATALPTINRAVQNAAMQTGLSNIKVMDLSLACLRRSSALRQGRRPPRRGGPPQLARSGRGGQDGVDRSDPHLHLGDSVLPAGVAAPELLGQLALRACLRQAYNRGNPRAGSCRIAGPGLNTHGEPNMTLG